MRRPDPSGGARRVLFVVNDPRFFVTHRLGLAQGIREAGYDVHVAVPDERNDLATIQAAGFAVHRVSIDRQGLNPFSDLRTIFELQRLYRRVRPTIVHHVTIKPVLYGSIAARLAGVPCVVNAISGLGSLFAEGSRLAAVRSTLARMAYRMLLSHPRVHVIFQNEDDREVFVRGHIVAARDTTLIFGSGVDLAAFAPEIVPEEPPIVLLPSRFLKQKGIREFAEAARKLKNEGISARFVLVGDAAENRDAIARADLERWCAEGVIENWGWTNDMAGVVARSSIVCLPSYYREGIPKALIDGSAGGRPLVTTNMPGCRDVVAPGVNGLLIPPRDVDALAAALRTLLLDPAARARMGREARRIAEARYALRSVVDATIGVYRSLEAQLQVSADAGDASSSHLPTDRTTTAPMSTR